MLPGLYDLFERVSKRLRTSFDLRRRGRKLTIWRINKCLITEDGEGLCNHVDHGLCTASLCVSGNINSQPDANDGSRCEGSKSENACASQTAFVVCDCEQHD